MTAPAAHIETAPPWAMLLGGEAGRTDWIVGPPLPSGVPVPATIVRVVDEGGFLFASERDPGTQLPRRCPELHIVAGSRFCLGLRDNQSEPAANTRVFWQDLGEFLINQHHAARRGRWPAGRWLSHGGTAAKKHLEAEALASTINVEGAYSDCIENEEGWIADAARTDSRRMTGSMPCPVGCIDQDGTVAKLVTCGHLNATRRLVAIERDRRSAQDDYYRTLRREGFACCGRMPDCPLRKRIAA